MNVETFEQLLSELCARLTDECRSGQAYDQSKPFENRVREVIKTLLDKFKIAVDFSPHPYGFPDIVLGQFGIEVKFTTNDTWRSVANSVFESFRNKNVKHIYVVFGKMGGERAVRWGRYEQWEVSVPPEERIREWLKRADEQSTTWVPSKKLFLQPKPQV